MVGNEEHGKGGLFGQLFGGKRTRKAKSAFGDERTGGDHTESETTDTRAVDARAVDAQAGSRTPEARTPEAETPQEARNQDRGSLTSQTGDSTVAAEARQGSLDSAESDGSAAGEGSTLVGRDASAPSETSAVAPKAEPDGVPDPFALVSPFSPFSVQPEPQVVPAPPAADSASPVELMFKEPDLPERDGPFDEELPDHVESVHRRTRKRDSGRRARHSAAEGAEERIADEPARARKETPTKVKGSTRLEAKKQRRNASRDAGRRRQSVTEVEFQARREAVDRQMIVRSSDDRIQIGVLEDDILVEHYAAHSRDLSLIGNVYLGRIQNVLPSMEAAFVDIGRGRNAVLYSGEVDWEAAEVTDKQRRIEMALKAGDTVLVQVTKDPVGHKGARLTSQISLPGRYLVYVPGGSMSGISRKLPDSERSRLKKTLKEILPENVGVIVRTAAEGATQEQLERDVTRLQQQWEEIQRLRETQQAPALLHTEPNLLIKVVRDVFNEDITKMVISGEDAEETIEKYLHTIAPDLVDRVEHYSGDKDIFDAYRINEQLAKASERKVFLPSGGSLVIDRTEAMTVIDVNTGKFVGSGGNLEETVTKNNLEAAEEIVRQLRLRDLGGIVVVDFIDMVLESNRDLVMQRLIECLGRDRTKHQVAEVTSLGLIQMTRKKIGIGLAETFTQLGESTAPGNVPQSAQAGKSGSSRKPRSKKSQQSTKPIKPIKNTLNANVKNAVAQVAASTIAQAGTASHSSAEPTAVVQKKADPDAAVTSGEAAAQHSSATAAPKAAGGETTERKSHPRRASSPAGPAAGEATVGPDSNAAAARREVSLDLDLPAPKQERQDETSSPAADREALLADVLAHLPEGARTPNAGSDDGEAGGHRG